MGNQITQFVIYIKPHIKIPVIQEDPHMADKKTLSTTIYHRITKLKEEFNIKLVKSFSKLDYQNPKMILELYQYYKITTQDISK